VLCAGTGRVVLAITATGPPTLDDLCERVTWAAAYGTELGARPDDLLVTSAGTATAAALRHRARAEGWPRLTVLGDPAADVEIDRSRSTY
jgi:acetyl esterase/lipase